MKNSYFTRHLKESEEGYFEHLLFSISMSAWLAKICIILILHALFPFLFVSKTSINIRKVNQIIQIRANKTKQRKQAQHQS